MSDSGSNDTDSADVDDADSDSERSSRFESLRSRLDGADETPPADADRGDTGSQQDDGDSAAEPDEWRWSTATDDDSGTATGFDEGETGEAGEHEDATVTAGSDRGSDETVGGSAGTRETTDAVDTGTRPDERSADRGGRIWDRDEADEVSSDAESIDPSDPATTDSGTAASASDRVAQGWNPDADGESKLPVDIEPGTSVLVQSESRDDRTDHACHELLEVGREGASPRVLLVRYQELDPDRLAQIAGNADRLKLIAIGYRQSVPASVDDVVDSVQITNPNDITRLGIVVSGTIDSWAIDDRPIAVCFDSLNVVLNYRDVKSTFRFLHVLLNTLHGGGAVSHFHADPLAGNPQDLSTLKPLFDEVVAIDSTGVHTE